ncbi:MAG: adenylate/guanylate cyclase domain-containing protein [Eubacteriales bacterium]|nr:adenylate/guanylate cyclase domain-containing protein [Eubacteriales bacterium]
MNTEELIRKSIISDMSEGVMTIGFDGLIGYVNPAAEQILDLKAEDLVGKRFARCFFEYSENDAFNQCILEAVYDATTSHKNIVPYFTGSETRQLHITTSYLHSDGERIGVIAVLSDISELSELRDAVKAMERIKALNAQLELRNQLLNETFGRFLSDEIVRQLLETPDGLALGGKKRTLTVMMSDLRGFTAISERMEAGSLLSMLNLYLAEMTDCIQRHNGTIIEFLGDGIMAIFGAPAPSKDHASDAIAAAIEMQSRMSDINRRNAELGYPTLEMGIGLNTGDVIVGNIGSEKRTKYGVVGSHVNLCGRIESYTVGGQVLISPITRQMACAELEIRQEQKIMPKGVKEPLTISWVTGIGAPYDLSCEVIEEQPEPLAKPIPVSFVAIEGKHCGDSEETGVFAALSRHGALLKTSCPLAPYDNIRLEAGGDLFAKVLDEADGGWLLRFTSVPTQYAAWLAEHDA